MKNVKKIVLTGGPCAGKTVALSAIKDRFGDDCLLIPEAATELLSIPYDQGGPGIPGRDLPFSQEWAEKFQKMVTERQQLDLANATRNAEMLAKKSGRPVIVVSDRGILDGAAYGAGREDFLQKYNLELENCFALYDQVIHLNSVATDDPEKYEELKSTNVARHENAQVAQELDNALFQAYEGHPRHLRIPNERGIEFKIETVIKEIKKIKEGQHELGNEFVSDIPRGS